MPDELAGRFRESRENCAPASNLENVLRHGGRVYQQQEGKQSEFEEFSFMHERSFQSVTGIPDCCLVDYGVAEPSSTNDLPKLIARIVTFLRLCG